MPLWKGGAWMEQPSSWEYDKEVSILLCLTLCFPSMVPSYYTTLEWAALFHQDLLHTFCLGSAHSDGYRWPCTKNSENKNQGKPLFSSSFELFVSTPYHNRKLTDLSPRKLLFYLFTNSCIIYLPCVCMCVMTHEQRSEKNFLGSVFPFCHLGSGEEPRVVVLGSKRFYSLICLLSPVLINFL